MTPAPSPFVPGNWPEELAWLTDEASRDFLGNEYLLWLWFMLDSEADTIKLSDGTEAAVMLGRRWCWSARAARHGRETILSDAPTRLPEARRAVQAGKLPRKVGLTVVRHDQQYELTLHAESLAVSGARLPAPEATEDARSAGGKDYPAATPHWKPWTSSTKPSAPAGPDTVGTKN